MNLEISGIELTIALVALLLGGFLKGVTGLGLPLMITPPLAWIFGIQTAVPLVAIPTLITNLFFIGRYRHAWREAVKVWPMVAAGMAAIVGGVFLLRVADQEALAVILSLLAIGYALTGLAGYEPKVSLDRLSIFGPAMGVVAGFFHGTTGVSGPMVVAYLAGIKDFSREAYFHAMGFIFLIFGMQQITGYLLSGIYTGEIFRMGLLTTVPVVGSFYLGNWLQGKLNARKFKMFTLALILISGLNLLLNNL